MSRRVHLLPFPAARCRVHPLHCTVVFTLSLRRAIAFSSLVLYVVAFSLSPASHGRFLPLPFSALPPSSLAFPAVVALFF
ncbi:hypothetical protein BVRB_8g184230 [Beta vulgaris subsp. vulgaris]|nr:hypothetical protein BVRB_8g184230 [Beta vulgaris subsp. vulgaris]